VRAVNQAWASGIDFGIETAGLLMTQMLSRWTQDLGLLVERIETMRPPGATRSWQPGAVVRLPYSSHISREDGTVCEQAIMAAAQTAMVLAGLAACNGARSVAPIEQSSHFVRPASFDILADARVLRAAKTLAFVRATLVSVVDRRPIGMVSGGFELI
jgi:acyl-coenzyme A thioesterase PaaI-like protein